jgi:Family of unknown function (DUF5695)
MIFRIHMMLVLCFLFSAPPAIVCSQTITSSSGEFQLKFEAGAITSLQRSQDQVNTDYIQSGRRLGDVFIRYRGKDGAWQSADTEQIAAKGSGTFTSSTDNKEYHANYEVLYAPTRSNTGPTATAAPAIPILGLSITYTIQPDSVVWRMTIRNLVNQSRQIDDLALPLPITRIIPRGNDQPAINILKHSFVSGHNSYIFWMRSNNVGPHLMLLPLEDTKFEYWDALRTPGGAVTTQATGQPTAQTGGGYRIYMHSAAAGTEARAQGTRWRQPNTGLTLSPKGQPGDSRSYGFKLRWANDYDAVREILVNEGLIDVHVVPGMTLPSDLFARFALRTRQTIHNIEAEYPNETEIKPAGAKAEMHFYEVRFKKLGENRLTIRFGKNQHTFLEFFSTEPLETLIKKRAAFLARSQHRDPAKWYNGLITDWNMESKVLLSPDNYDRIQSWRIYAVTCDDPGLGKPAYLAAKNAEFPVADEINALDYYIKHFVWGGLQQTSSEPYPYAVYGIPDWKTNRESADPGRNGQRHLWRIYDYPHVVLLYYSMYRIAKNYPHIKTELPAMEYLRRAYGTAIALFTVPMEIERWSAYRTGLYNELVIVELIDALQNNGMTGEAEKLRGHWEQKVRTFVNGRLNLFQSEYSFDSTGFEATHALAKYAINHAVNPKLEVSLENAERFMKTQLAANIFCRGWLEPAYYYLGSDYRGNAGNSFTLSYMSQMGGWSVLDYALSHARNPSWYLRLGYASYLSAWALMNTGTPQSNYGYWYPGKENDGAAGGGFEPAPYGQTWLQQPHHRGSWYYASEVDLGYSGALRAARSVVADDPVFGRFCFGCELRNGVAGIEVIPRDGVRRRLHLIFGHDAARKVQMLFDSDRFDAKRPIVIKEDLSQIRFELETDNPTKHVSRLRISGLPAATYVVSSVSKTITVFEVKDGNEIVIELPIVSQGRAASFVISRQKVTRAA